MKKKKTKKKNIKKEENHFLDYHDWIIDLDNICTVFNCIKILRCDFEGHLYQYLSLFDMNSTFSLSVQKTIVKPKYRHRINTTGLVQFIQRQALLYMAISLLLRSQVYESSVIRKLLKKR